MNELHFISKLRQQLNRGLHDLPPETLARLSSARKIALAHQKSTAQQSVLATAGNFIQFELGNLQLRQFLLAGLLVGGLVLSSIWLADRRVEEMSIIDSALLSDDLPLGAFTDKGFNAWLKHRSQD